GVPARGGRISFHYYKSSSAIGFLCLGFLRAFLGWMGLAAGTGPTRSRASLRTSFFMSNLFFRAMCNPHGLVRSSIENSPKPTHFGGLACISSARPPHLHRSSSPACRIEKRVGLTPSLAVV